MQDITEDEVRRTFSEKTFSRGLDYFKEGYVKIGVKKGNNLTGEVIGSAPQPYKVKIEITDTIYSECTCPVGDMCKHGVALLLQWIHEKDSFVDADHLLTSLRKRSKEELIEIIGSILEDDPITASKLAFSEAISEKKINIEAISRKIRYIGGGDLNYYAVSGVVEELEPIKELGDNLAEDGSFRDAIEVYLLLIQWGIDAYEGGADDSDGIIGDFVIGCVEDFSENVERLEEKQKENLLYRIIDIVNVEDYGLETEEMLYSLATKENMSIIEAELLRRMPINEKDSHGEYAREKTLDLLSGLYQKLGMQEDALKVLERAGLKNEDDGVRMAEILMKRGEHAKAFKCAREGLPIGEDKLDDRLLGLYFVLLNRFLEEKGEIEPNVEEAMALALHLLSHFSPEMYTIIREVFQKIGKHEELMLNIKKKCEENVVAEVLLYENHIDEAIEYALSSSALYPGMLMKIAEIAKEREREKALNLIIKALKERFASIDEKRTTLIEFFVKESDENQLKEAVNLVRSTFLARVFVDSLLKRNQEYAVNLLKKFIADIGKGEVKGYAARLEDKYAMELCRSWVSEFVNRSHVYYDDVIDVLKVMKKRVDEKEWKEYISALMERNAGKKKLLEKMRTEIIFKGFPSG